MYAVAPVYILDRQSDAWYMHRMHVNTVWHCVRKSIVFLLLFAFML